MPTSRREKRKPGAAPDASDAAASVSDIAAGSGAAVAPAPAAAASPAAPAAAAVGAPLAPEAESSFIDGIADAQGGSHPLGDAELGNLVADTLWRELAIVDRALTYGMKKHGDQHKYFRTTFDRAPTRAMLSFSCENALFDVLSESVSPPVGGGVKVGDPDLLHTAPLEAGAAGGGGGAKVGDPHLLHPAPLEVCAAAQEADADVVFEELLTDLFGHNTVLRDVYLEVAFCLGHGGFVPKKATPKDHVDPYDFIRDDQDRLLEWLNTKSPEFRKAFFTPRKVELPGGREEVCDMGQLFAQELQDSANPQGPTRIKGRLYFFMRSYNAMHNLMVLCQVCNSGKSNTDPIVWAKESPMLGEAFKQSLRDVGCESLPGILGSVVCRRKDVALLKKARFAGLRVNRAQGETTLSEGVVVFHGRAEHSKQLGLAIREWVSKNRKDHIQTLAYLNRHVRAVVAGSSYAVLDFSEASRARMRRRINKALSDAASIFEPEARKISRARVRGAAIGGVGSVSSDSGQDTELVSRGRQSLLQEYRSYVEISSFYKKILRKIRAFSFSPEQKQELCRQLDRLFDDSFMSRQFDARAWSALHDGVSHLLGNGSSAVQAKKSRFGSEFAKLKTQFIKFSRTGGSFRGGGGRPSALLSWGAPRVTIAQEGRDLHDVLADILSVDDPSLQQRLRQALEGFAAEAAKIRDERVADAAGGVGHDEGDAAAAGFASGSDDGGSKPSTPSTY